MTTYADPIYLPIRRKHIDEGVPSDSNSCAIALALQDYYPDATHVGVGFSTANVDTPEDYISFELSPAAQDFIDLFDNATDRREIRPRRIKLTPRFR